MQNNKTNNLVKKQVATSSGCVSFLQRPTAAKGFFLKEESVFAVLGGQHHREDQTQPYSVSSVG